MIISSPQRASSFYIIQFAFSITYRSEKGFSSFWADLRQMPVDSLLKSTSKTRGTGERDVRACNHAKVYRLTDDQNAELLFAPSFSPDPQQAQLTHTLASKHRSASIVC